MSGLHFQTAEHSLMMKGKDRKPHFTYVKQQAEVEVQHTQI